MLLLRNLKWGHERYASEKAAEHIVSTCKKWNGQPVWKIVKETEAPKVVDKEVRVETESAEDGIEKIRKEYEEVLGKKPHHKLSVLKMVEAIENAKN